MAPQTSSPLSNLPKYLGPNVFAKPKSKSKNPIASELVDDNSSDTGTHSQYRANYPIEFSPHALEENFFKSLESKFAFHLKNNVKEYFFSECNA